VDDLRVHQHELFARVFFEGYIDDRQVLRDADLRRGQADAVGLVHGFKHFFNQLAQFGVEDRYRLGGFFEDRIAIFYDGVNHQQAVSSLKFLASNCSEGRKQDSISEAVSSFEQILRLAALAQDFACGLSPQQAKPGLAGDPEAPALLTPANRFKFRVSVMYLAGFKRELWLWMGSCVVYRRFLELFSAVGANGAGMGIHASVAGL